MKKIFFVFVIAATAYQSKAQEKFSMKPSDSLTSKLWSPSFIVKPTDSAFYKKYFNMPHLNPSATNKPANIEVFSSTMPVVKVGSPDKMSIVKPENSSERYTMLIKKIKVVNPLEKKFAVIP